MRHTVARWVAHYRRRWHRWRDWWTTVRNLGTLESRITTAFGRAQADYERFQREIAEGVHREAEQNAGVRDRFLYYETHVPHIRRCRLEYDIAHAAPSRFAEPSFDNNGVAIKP